jgi:hypothetical protein
MVGLFLCLYCPEALLHDPYIENKLRLFDLLRILNSSRIKATNVSHIFEETINILVEHSGLFQPTEKTYALHKLDHVVQQITSVGPSKSNNLLMYERVNSALKRMIKTNVTPWLPLLKLTRYVSQI